MRMFSESLGGEVSIEDLIDILSNAQEFAELPVRHNEDQINGWADRHDGGDGGCGGRCDGRFNGRFDGRCERRLMHNTFYDTMHSTVRGSMFDTTCDTIDGNLDHKPTIVGHMPPCYFLLFPTPATWHRNCRWRWTLTRWTRLTQRRICCFRRISPDTHSRRRITSPTQNPC